MTKYCKLCQEMTVCHDMMDLFEAEAIILSGNVERKLGHVN